MFLQTVIRSVWGQASSSRPEIILAVICAGQDFPLSNREAPNDPRFLNRLVDTFSQFLSTFLPFLVDLNRGMNSLLVILPALLDTALAEGNSAEINILHLPPPWCTRSHTCCLLLNSWWSPGSTVLVTTAKVGSTKLVLKPLVDGTFRPSNH